MQRRYIFCKLSCFTLIKGSFSEFGIFAQTSFFESTEDYICNEDTYATKIYMQQRYICNEDICICNEDIYATKICMQRRYICNGDIYATKIYMQQGYICNEETHLVESAADDDIAAGLDNCVGRAQLGPNLLAPNLVKICEGLCFVFCVLYFGRDM